MKNDKDGGTIIDKTGNDVIQQLLELSGATATNTSQKQDGDTEQQVHIVLT